MRGRRGEDDEGEAAKRGGFEDKEEDDFGVELVDLGDVGSAIEAFQTVSTELCFVRAIRTSCVFDASACSRLDTEIAESHV